MKNIKVGDWVVNIGDIDARLTIGKKYKVNSVGTFGIEITDDKGNDNGIIESNLLICKIEGKYRNPPREEYRELCEAWLAGADLSVEIVGSWCIKQLFVKEFRYYRINPDSIIPPVDERKERIKQQLLKIGVDKLAQFLIDRGIDL